MSALLSFPASPPTLRVVAERAADFVSIRGVRLLMDQMVDASLFTPEARERLRNELLAAKPFPHLVLKNLFNPALLDLVQEEFEMHGEAGWSDVRSSYEWTRRSVLGTALGPASQIYFDIVNSGWFTQWLSAVTGTPYLLADPLRFGGGLHESKPGGSFAIHRDFNFHPHVGLKNEMVFITYLNRDWQPEWGGALELWDAKEGECKASVQPDFGTTLLLPHGPNSFHGHPAPLRPPEGRTRRSVAAYFYTSAHVGKRDPDHSASIFMKTRKVDQVKTVVRMLTPPVIWKTIRKLKRAP